MGGLTGTITFQEAQRFTSGSAFSLMIKPLGSRCNLKCDYCYYLDKARNLYGGREPLMDLALLEHCIRNFLESCTLPEPTIEWHGGEPLLAGLDYFRAALSFEKKYAGGRQVQNTIQTNGTLLDAGWAAFFADNNFLVGLSLDGPERIHNACRGGSFAAAMRGLEALQSRDVQFNTLTTISRAGEGCGREVYTFLKGVGSRYMQFMPVYEYLTAYHGADASASVVCAPPFATSASRAPWSVTPKAFGQYLCDVFDEWIRGDVGEYYVLTFDAALSSWCGVPPGICTFCPTCGGNLVVEHNGDVFPCDHFVYPHYKIGNVQSMSLSAAASSAQMTAFGMQKRTGLPQSCMECPWVAACCGGCPKHRFSKGLNDLCDGYKMFYEHIAPAMSGMKRLLEQGRSPAEYCSKNLQ